ncbi:MAG: MFS transporter [Halobacteriovoraceae bacterium]|nr:MFS transporter [Halobacteriovoraceae bacterium]
MLKPTCALRWGHFLSVLGERLTFVSIILYCQDFFGISTGTIVALSLYTLTFVVVSPFSARILNSFNKKKILIVSDIIRSFLVISYIPFLSHKEHTIPPIIFIIFLVISISTIARNAFWSIIPDVVHSNDIQNFNMKISLNESVGLAIGTALGGLLLKWMSYKYIFIFDSITYIISMFCLMSVEYEDKTSKIKNDSPKTRISDFVNLLDDKVLLSMTFAIVFTCILSGFSNSFIVSNIQQSLNLSKDHVGYSFSVLAVGSWLAPKFLEHTRLSAIFESLKMYLIILCGSIATLSITRNIFVFYVLCFLTGVIITSGTAKFNTLAMMRLDFENRNLYISYLTSLIRFFMFIGIVISPIDTRVTVCIFASVVMLVITLFKKNVYV